MHGVIFVTGSKAGLAAMYRHCAKMSDCTPDLILGCLRSILSGRSEERQKAEEEIRVLEVGDSERVCPFGLARIAIFAFLIKEDLLPRPSFTIVL